VAPGGCRVALSLGPSTYQGARPYPNIKIVDVCSAKLAQVVQRVEGLAHA